MVPLGAAATDWQPVSFWLLGGALLLTTWMNVRWRPQQIWLNRGMAGAAVAFLAIGLASWLIG
jgi:hypothetical protein